MPSAQELIDEVSNKDIDYNIDVSVKNSDVLEEVEAELQNSIYQELTVPVEERNIYWAQTLIDSV